MCIIFFSYEYADMKTYCVQGSFLPYIYYFFFVNSLSLSSTMFMYIYRSIYMLARDLANDWYFFMDVLVIHMCTINIIMYIFILLIYIYKSLVAIRYSVSHLNYFYFVGCYRCDDSMCVCLCVVQISSASERASIMSS